MKRTNITRRLNYYCKWYQEMPDSVRCGMIGAWVLERIVLLTTALTELHREVERNTAPNVGNYKAA